MKKLDKIDHIAIQVDDINESLNWYLKNFKCEKIYSDETWAFIKFHNTKLALVTNTEHPPHFAILDTNLNIEDNKVVKHRDGSYSKYAKDLDGNFLEYIKYKK
tara:strand:- start:13525 stop:13833 length:309 start_codon:yes stop_codon:yes gene_type:complete